MRVPFSDYRNISGFHGTQTTVSMKIFEFNTTPPPSPFSTASRYDRGAGMKFYPFTKEVGFNVACILPTPQLMPYLTLALCNWT